MAPPNDQAGRGYGTPSDRSVGRTRGRHGVPTKRNDSRIGSTASFESVSLHWSVKLEH